MTIEQLIASLSDQRAAHARDLVAISEVAAAESRATLTEEEQGRYDGLRGQIAALDERITDLRTEQERLAQAGAAAASSGIRLIRERGTYDRGSRFSFFRDVTMASLRQDRDSYERLTRHAREQQDELQRRSAAIDAFSDEWSANRFSFDRGGRVEAEMRRQRAEVERRDLSRIDGAGGEFVPPLWLIDEYVAVARAARQFADSFNSRPLPGGTDTIAIPRVKTGTQVAVQAADNNPVQATDATTDSISVPVITIAGQQDMAMQLIEQSPISFDEVVFADLAADYAAKVDIQAHSGSGAGGQAKGVLSVPGENVVTYTDAAPTVAALYPKVAGAVAAAAAGRKLPPTRIFMSPRRWYWHTAALDAQGRPLVPMDGGVFNAAALGQDVAAEGPVGRLQGLPVLIDPNLPEGLGAGLNEDRVIVARFADFWLWESFLRTRVLPEVNSGKLNVRLQVYSYLALTAERYPSGTSVIGGTGLVTPTF